MKLISAILLPIILIFMFSCTKGDVNSTGSKKDSLMLLTDYQMAGTTDAGHTYFHYDPVTRNLDSVTFSLNTDKKNFYYDDKNKLSLVVYSTIDPNTKYVYQTANVFQYDAQNRINKIVIKIRKTNQTMADFYDLSVPSDIDHYILLQYNSKGQVERVYTSEDAVANDMDDRYDFLTYHETKDSLLLAVHTYLAGSTIAYDGIYLKSDTTRYSPFPANSYLFNASLIYWLNPPSTYLDHYAGKGPYMYQFARIDNTFGYTQTSNQAYLYNDYNLPTYGTDGYFNSFHYTYMRVKK